MKKNAKPAKKPAKTARTRKKALNFEDGVKTALVAGVVICALTLGAAAFFAVRSVMGGGFIPPESAEVSGQPAEPTEPAKPAVPLEPPAQPAAPAKPAQPNASSTDDSSDILPELADEIRRLEAEQAREDARAAKPARQQTPKPQKPAAAKKPEAEPGEILPPERKGILVFVIDDAGNNLAELDPFLKIPGPLTVAVLPGLQYSAEAARRVRNAKKEAFLHQPMEPLGGQNPGPGAVKTGMGAEEIKAIINNNLDEVWPVAGLNNHEGSKATMDAAIMQAVLDVCAERGIFFLDSRTTADTAAPIVAAEAGIAIAERDVFLDNLQDRASIIAAVEEGCKKAERNGVAVMIGHTWTPSLAAILTELYPKLRRRGFYITTISGILDIGK